MMYAEHQMRRMIQEWIEKYPVPGPRPVMREWPGGARIEFPIIVMSPVITPKKFTKAIINGVEYEIEQEEA